MRKALPLLLLPLVGGCAGYAADYWKPKEDLIAPQLPRFGFDESQTRCITERLTEDLTVWQLRQLADFATRLRGGGANPAELAPRDLLYAAGLAKDPGVRTGAEAALESCGVTAAAAAAPPARPVPDPAPAAPQAPAIPADPSGARWLDLGTAPTGQGISVDVASIENGTGWRQGWFRMSNPGEAGPGLVSYLLRIDCSANTITPMAARKYDEAGAVVEHVDHGPEWAVPLPVDPGTVMELAHRALCA